MHGNEFLNFAVVVENPTYVETQYMKLKVSHGNYDVYRFNPDTGKNEKQPAEVICLERYLEDGSFIHDCDMHINATVARYSHTIILLEYNKATNLELEERAVGLNIIESDYEKYTYLGTREEGIVF